MHRGIALLYLVLLSCNNPDASDSRNKRPDEEQQNASAPLTAQDVSGCYMRVLDRDTFVAVLQQQGHSITGRLTFDNYQKDGSTGHIKGQIQDSIIRLVYTFRSEGMNSVMDVYFKANGNSLICGIGDMKTKGDTAYFVNPASVRFPQADKLVKYPCDQLPEKYR